jgi:sugar phosphate isomerase/epimerase
VFDLDEIVLWGGTLGHADLVERADAAAGAGFGAITLFPTDYRRARAEGLSDADIRALHAARDLRLTTLDPLARWLPDWCPPAGIGAARLAAIDSTEEEFLAIAEALGLESLTAIQPFQEGRPVEAMTASFAHLCDRAAEVGVRVHLEFLPWGDIPDLETAWAIVADAARPNGGLTFDTWHYFRGRRDDRLLQAIPGERIFTVQVEDAAAVPAGTLVEDAWQRRRMPGEGDLDLRPVLAILDRKDGIGPAGVEVFSTELAVLPVDEFARRAATSLRAEIVAARGPDAA